MERSTFVRGLICRFDRVGCPDLGRRFTVSGGARGAGDLHYEGWHILYHPRGVRFGRSFILEGLILYNVVSL